MERMWVFLSTLIQEKLQELSKNHTPINEIKFFDFVRSCRVEDVLESSKKLFLLPRGIELMKEVYEGYNLPFETLKQEQEKVLHVYNRISESTVYELHEKLLQPLFECNSILENKIHIMDQDEYLIESTIAHFEKELEAVRKVISKEIVTEGFEPDGRFVTTLSESVAKEFSLEYVKLSGAKTDEEVVESITKLYRLADRYDETLMDSVAMESNKVYNTVKKAAIRADEKGRKLTHSIRKSTNDGKRIKTIVTKTPKRLMSLADKTINDVKKLDQDARRKAIIEGGVTKKLFKVIRMAIISGAVGAAISPAIGAVTLLSMAYRHKTVDTRDRNELVKDLETELRILKEKIRDADGKGDRQTKYQLMRLEDKITTEISRIKYGNKAVNKMSYKELKQGDN